MHITFLITVSKESFLFLVKSDLGFTEKSDGEFETTEIT